jgi:putative transposase
MEQLKAFKYRLYPTPKQEQYFARVFGAVRWIKNTSLASQKERLSKKEKLHTNFDINYSITELKKQPETAWLKEVDSIALQNAAEDHWVAYKNFFDSIKGKRKGPKVEQPTFKSKHGRQSYRTRGVTVDFVSGVVTIPKIKAVKAVLHRDFIGTIKQAAISKNTDGRYYISILVSTNINLSPMTGKEVGCDLGLKDIIITSDGIKFNHPEQMLSKAKRSLKQEQKKLSRMKKQSKNYTKQKVKVAKAYSRVTRIRNEYYHLISKFLIDNYDSIYLEDLNVTGMMKNKKLSRKIQESAWSTLKNMIAYKAAYAGKTFHQIGRFVPSTKTCSCCGYKLPKIGLNVREWDCPSCHAHHDRDLNAAINIMQFGQIDLYDKILTSDAIAEAGALLPMALKKHSAKIERSSSIRTGLNEEQASLTVFSC